MAPVVKIPLRLSLGRPNFALVFGRRQEGLS